MPVCSISEQLWTEKKTKKKKQPSGSVATEIDHILTQSKLCKLFATRARLNRRSTISCRNNSSTSV